MSPTLKSSFFAVASSITISFGPGQPPSTSLSGLKGESPLAMLKPMLGALPTIALPSLSIRTVDSLSTPPSACATSGSVRTRSSRLSSSVGASLPLPSVRSNADRPVTTASEPWRTSLKIASNAWSIESVRT